jgi:hypothetical protein
MQEGHRIARHAGYPRFRQIMGRLILTIKGSGALHLVDSPFVLYYYNIKNNL